jgi:hypothetical protein
VGELEHVVGEADEALFEGDLVEAAQQELAETSGLLDLPEHRLGQLLAQAIRGVVAGPDLLAHGRHAFASAFAVDRCLARPAAMVASMLWLSLASRLASEQQPASAGTCSGLRPMWLRPRRPPASVDLVARVGVEAVSDDHLLRRVRRRLRVVALNEAALGSCEGWALRLSFEIAGAG